MKQANEPNNNLIITKFKKNKLANWALRCFYIFLFITIFGDFIANNKPIVCKTENKWQFPIIQAYASNLEIIKLPSDWNTTNWHEKKYQFSIFPLIPYSSTFQDRKNMRSVSPFEKQNLVNQRFKHVLGTDILGRDVAAGLVAGTRTAMLVGFVSMIIATIIGILLGSFAGFYSDSSFRLSLIVLMSLLVGNFVAFFLVFITYPQQFIAFNDFNFIHSLTAFFVFFFIIFMFYLLGKILDNWIKSIKITIPLDLIIMRVIEIINSIPAFLLLLAVAGIIQKPSVVYLLIIIGLIRWTGIAKFIRAELLKIRTLGYIEAGKALGFSEYRIMMYHAIPNALRPVMISFAFGIASSILLESALSFLGIGVAAEVVTWGSMLEVARNDFSAWWLAVFPGLAIFISVTTFNLIGEGLSDALNPKE